MIVNNFPYLSQEDISNPSDVSEKKQNKKLEKGIKRLLIVVSVIFAAQLIWLFIVTPFIPFSAIEVQGIDGLNRQEILLVAGIDETSSFFSTNANNVQKILSNHILVESAVVMKRFPDKMSIFLSPREAAAITIANNGSKQVMMFVDRQGVFFKTCQLNEGAGLPVISGIENPQLNSCLPAALVSLTENLYQLSSNSPELLSAISEIRIERKAWEGYDLVLFPVHGSISVRIENNLTEDVLRYMLVMLNILETDNQKPVEIDFRSGMGSYTLKEQNS